MKKLALYSIVILATLLSLTSCKHDYTCRCTILGVVTTEEWDDIKLKDRGKYKDQCDDDNQQAESVGGSCVFDED